ncbi:hypothetical protein BGX31_009981 [Mortierella sp. GBA43]|nr:hypothetical protein BGX31_009981 [Mortierella sp. GBA43]
MSECNSSKFNIINLVTRIHSVTGLFSFAIDRIIRVAGRDHVFERKTVEAKNVPDIILCTFNATVMYSEGFFYTAIPIKGSSIPPGFKVYSPCVSGDTMFVIWTDFARLISDRTPGKKGTRVLDPDADMMLEFHVQLNSTDPMNASVIYPTDNVFRQLTLLPDTADSKQFKTNMKFHSIQPNEAAYMTPSTLMTKPLRGGLFGLLGLHEKEYSYDVSSAIDITNSPQYARLLYRVSDTWEMNEEVLLMSVPDALASWGGVFSLVVTVFYVLFGSRQMSPFGVIQTYLLSTSTKKAVKNVYGKRVHHNANENDDKNTDTLEEQEEESSSQRIAIDMLDQEDPSRPSGQWSLEDMKEELTLLRNRLREHEERSKRFEHFESLVRDLYLDMGLVDKAIPTAASIYSVKSFTLSGIVIKMRDTVRRLFKT